MILQLQNGKLSLFYDRQYVMSGIADYKEVKEYHGVLCIGRRAANRHRDKRKSFCNNSGGRRSCQVRRLAESRCMRLSILLSAEAMGGIGEDIFVEVSHDLIGGALAGVGTGVNNGARTMISPRYTPYHVQHRTEIAGFMTILHGDMRFYNNVFVQPEIPPFLKRVEAENFATDWDDMNTTAGTKPYDGYQTFEEWNKEFEGYCGMGSAPSDRYYIPLPVWTGGNRYYNGARSCDKETDFIEDTEHTIRLELKEEDGCWMLYTNLGEYLPRGEEKLITTDKLGMAFEPEQRFENPDGTDIIFDEDYYGEKKECVTAGPFDRMTDVMCVYKV